MAAREIGSGVVGFLAGAAAVYLLTSSQSSQPWTWGSGYGTGWFDGPYSRYGDMGEGFGVLQTGPSGWGGFGTAGTGTLSALGTTGFGGGTWAPGLGRAGGHGGHGGGHGAHGGRGRRINGIAARRRFG